MDITENFNNWVDKNNTKRNWSLRRLARECGISQPHITNIRNGERSVTWDVVAAIAGAYRESKISAFRAVGLLPGNPQRIADLHDAAAALADDQVDELIEYVDYISNKRRAA